MELQKVHQSPCLLKTKWESAIQESPGMSNPVGVGGLGECKA